MSQLKNYCLLLLFFLSFIFTAHSQKQTCTIYFDDTTTITGLARIRNDNFIKFKLNEDAESTDYDPMIIDKIVFEKDGASQVYKYKKETGGFHMWLKVLIEGKVSLYRNDISSFYYSPFGMPAFGSNPAMGTGFGAMNTYSREIYYVANGEEFEVSKISSLNNIGKDSKKTASKFLGDCPALVEKITNKQYRKDDYYNVVKFYNTNCSIENVSASNEAKN